MGKTNEELLQEEYWIIDILPKQVPADSPGRYFAGEDYFLTEPRRTAIKQKHVNLILKLNCYRKIILDDAVGPSPEVTEEAMLSRYVSIRIDDSLITSAPDETYLTLFHPDEELLKLVRAIAAGEGLYVWQPRDTGSEQEKQ